MDPDKLRAAEARAKLGVATLQMKLEVCVGGCTCICSAPACIQPAGVECEHCERCAHCQEYSLPLFWRTQGHELQAQLSEARAAAEALRQQLEAAGDARQELQASVARLTTQVRRFKIDMFGG